MSRSSTGGGSGDRATTAASSWAAIIIDGADDDSSVVDVFFSWRKDWKETAAFLEEEDSSEFIVMWDGGWRLFVYPLELAKKSLLYKTRDLTREIGAHAL